MSTSGHERKSREGRPVGMLPRSACDGAKLAHDCPERQGNLTFRIALSSRSDTKVPSFDLIIFDSMAQGARRQSRDGYSLHFFNSTRKQSW
ncbi:MAG: hypothetical protein WAM90_15095 [Rhodanobacter sp.]